MTEIKSTLEKVLERAASMGRASQEELLAEEQEKRGMRLAADYLQGQELDLSKEMDEAGGSDLLRRGGGLVFLRNISLPRNGDLSRTERAMQGLLEMARGSSELVSVFREMKGILDHYQKHLKEVRQQVEDAFRQQLEQAMSQQTGQKGVGLKMNPALHPKFQEEWTRIKADLDDQYNKALQQLKQLVVQRFSVTL